MGGWGEYAAAWAVFLLSHMLPARPRLRRPLIAALGERGYVAAYSLVSVLVLAWLIVAAGRAPFVPLWGWAAWQAWVPNLAMPLACVLLALGLGIPNPFSIGGAQNDRFDPARPGVLALTRHPVLLAIVLWAASHVPPNGDLATATLFGAFAAMGLLGMRALDARRRRSWGEPRWRAMARGTGRLRIALPAVATPGLALRVAAGLCGWLLLLVLHPIVIGVAPLPALNRL
ncbi:MAG TPA: NnrU family protein [Falsiroseomonas sp.]|jgi:uncharacterized membrane protein|nr:NnrU family protein [Falsiroseomonas sp.]